MPWVTDLKLSVAVNSDTNSRIKTATLNPSRGVLKRLTINAVQFNSHKKRVELRYPTNESDK